MNERALRTASRVRGILIAYGVAAFGWLFSRGSPDQPSNTVTLIGIGLGVQLVFLIARVLVKRYEREHGMANAFYPQAMYVLELLADAVTVLLFAIGTFRAILVLPAEL